MHSEISYAGPALQAGARGYIMKQDGAERVMEAIREVFQGHFVISPKIRAALPKDLIK
jgi:DNA-binding NarL/FixJ family response regulator